MLRWVVAALVGLWPLAAFAQGSADLSFRLHWRAPDTCPSELDVAARIDHLLGASESQRRAPPVEAEAVVLATKGGFELELTLQQAGEARSRSVAAPTCEELSRAAALVVALAVDPSISEPARTDAPSSASFPSPCPPLESPTPSPAPVAACPKCPACRPPVRQPSLAPPWRVALVAGVSATYGELPRSWPRPLLGVGYSRGHHWFEISLGAAFSTSQKLGGPRVATFTHWFSVPRYCLETPLARWRMGGCGSAELGVIHASGFGVTQPLSRREWWVAAGLGLQAQAQLTSGTHLLLGADLLLAVTRPRFVLAGTPVHTTNDLLPALRLALVGGLL